MTTSTAAPAVTGPDARSVRRFQTRVAVCAGGGEVCDGWVLGVVGAALPLARSDLALGTTATGLIGASSLIGIFIGGLAFGRLTDRIGRQRMYLIDLLVFLVGSLLQLTVGSGTELFLVRLVMGMAVGADYAIAGALVAEFAPPARRGRLLGSLIAFWYVGYVMATLAGLAMAAHLEGPHVWRWILATSTLPSLVVLLARLGTPESPRWLAAQGRHQEADAVCRRRLGCTLAELDADAGPSTRRPSLFSPAYRGRALFTSTFWLCQVTPFFAISTFAPQVLSSLGATGGATEVVLNTFLLLGCVCGVVLMDRTGRRPLLIVPFVVATVALLVLGVLPNGPAPLIALCFAAFALSHAAGSTLQAVYPSEVFPTEIRATGIGFAAACSRIGGAVGTFLVPTALDAWGVGAVMLCGAALSLFGAAISLRAAPETRGMELSRAGTPDAPHT
ncbi:MFS transporter [Streptomyces griseorubiginosus]|uniref:MFS transporter n=1 Tax=Streptomyces griseorubiginosus TaxID=67304 RepID=UPI0036F05336